MNTVGSDGIALTALDGVNEPFQSVEVPLHRRPQGPESHDPGTVEVLVNSPLFQEPKRVLSCVGLNCHSARRSVGDGTRL